MTAKKIAIVGAGLAGLVAARELSRSGLAVEIFDKGRFAGGRLASRSRDTNQFDYGAQYFAVRDPRFARFLEPLSTCRPEPIVVPWSAQIFDISRQGRSVHQSSHERYVAVPTMRALAQALIDLPLETEPGSEEMAAVQFSLRLSSRVSSISRSGNQSWLGFEDRSTAGPYDFVILNMPPQQCLPFLGQSQTLHDLASSVEMAPCWAVMLSFASRLGTDVQAAFVEDYPCSWIACDSTKPGRPAGERWLVHGSAAWSGRHLQAEPDWVLAELKGALLDCLGLDAAAAPAVIFSKAHRWRYAIAVNPAAEGAGLLDEEAGLALCGDWLVHNRVEGAVLSGLNCAERLLSLGDFQPGQLKSEPHALL